MSGTTTGGGIDPHDVVFIVDPKGHKVEGLFRSELQKVHDALPENDPLRATLQPLLPIK